MEVQRADLLEVNADCIVQQCNCVTLNAQGLAASIASKYTYADLYGRRTGRNAICATLATQDLPGTCILARPPHNVIGPIVCHLLGQIAPGKSASSARKYGIPPGTDNTQCRLQYFRSALTALADICQTEDWKLVAFPFRIGCGLAGGSWPDYLAMLQEFSDVVSAYGVSVIICQQ